jgi:hypothetical protein
MILGPGFASTSDTGGGIFDQLLTEADDLIMHQISTGSFPAAGAAGRPDR